MKNLLSTVGVAIGLILSIAWTGQSNTIAYTKANLYLADTIPGSRSPFNTADLVDTTTTNRWKRRYSDMWNKLVDTLSGQPVAPALPLQFFTVHSRDLLLAMGLDTSSLTGKLNFDYVRIVIGYDSSLTRLKAIIQPVAYVMIDSCKEILYAGNGLYFNNKGQIVNGKRELVKSGATVVCSTCNCTPVTSAEGLTQRGLHKPMFAKHVSIIDSSAMLFLADLNTPCPSTCGN